jgi:hypothetical protein
MGVQIDWRGRNTHSTEVRWRSQDPTRALADFARGKSAHVIERTQAQRQVDAFSEQIDPAIRQHEVERISGCSARNDLSAGTMWIREKVTAAQTRSAPDKLVPVPRARTSASSAASIAAFARS